MKKFLLLFVILSGIAQAQYTTPNNGEAITLSDLLLIEPAIVVLSDTDEYTLNSDLVISTNDTLLMTESTTLRISPDVLVTIAGTWISNPAGIDNTTLITAVDSENPHTGFRLEEGSSTLLMNTHFVYGGGIRVLSEDFIMNNCEVKFQYNGSSTSAAIGLSRGNPEIHNTYFYQNQMPAIASGANQSVGLKFIGNTLESNTMGNSNRPQINISASGVNDTILIENNIILGNPNLPMVGGLAIANLFSIPNNVIVRNNQISDNRYGLTFTGPVDFGEIDNNLIENNNTQGEPNLGGSGINLISSGGLNQNVYIKNNFIAHNIWGITMQNTAYANLGDGSEISPGNNTFHENGFGGVVYAFYNNTPNDISAQGNCWIAGQESTQEQVEEVITHFTDDETLGLVDYSNFTCNLSVNDLDLTTKVEMYPNPARNVLFIEVSENAEVVFYNASGKVFQQSNLRAGKNEIKINFQQGLYFLQIKSNSGLVQKKLLVK